MAEIRWTPEAAGDLESIADFISLDSRHYASLFVIDVLSAIERLQQFPRLGRVVPETDDPLIREIILGNYRIVYRVLDEFVEVITIHHSSRLLNPDSLK